MLDPHLFHFACMLFQGGFLFCMPPGPRREKPSSTRQALALWPSMVAFHPPPTSGNFYLRQIVCGLPYNSQLPQFCALLVRTATEMADLCVTDLSLALAHNLNLIAT